MLIIKSAPQYHPRSDAHFIQQYFLTLLLWFQQIYWGAIEVHPAQEDPRVLLIVWYQPDMVFNFLHCLFNSSFILFCCSCVYLVLMSILFQTRYENTYGGNFCGIHDKSTHFYSIHLCLLKLIMMHFLERYVVYICTIYESLPNLRKCGGRGMIFQWLYSIHCIVT